MMRDNFEPFSKFGDLFAVDWGCLEFTDFYSRIGNFWKYLDSFAWILKYSRKIFISKWSLGINKLRWGFVIIFGQHQSTTSHVKMTTLMPRALIFRDKEFGSVRRQKKMSLQPTFPWKYLQKWWKWWDFSIS